jgi:hypothetical protein
MSLYEFNDEWIQKYIHPNILNIPDLALAIEEQKVNNVGTDIFVVPIFSETFCNEFSYVIQTLEEEKWTSGRHANYPTNDIIINDIGLGDVYRSVVYNFLIPIALNLYRMPHDTTEEKVLRNDFWSEDFLVRYLPYTQKALGIHHDNSLFTYNTVLNNNFIGGGTYFEKHEITVSPPPGYATLAPGLVTHKHGARPISKGERYMMVSFISKFVPPEGSNPEAKNTGLRTERVKK